MWKIIKSVQRQLIIVGKRCDAFLPNFRPSIACSSRSVHISHACSDSELVQKADDAEVAENSEESEKPAIPDCLVDFFDKPINWGKFELSEEDRPGREWRVEELRNKSNTDLHKLWYVLLKEKNMLLTMQHATDTYLQSMPNEERIYRVEMSMKNVEEVVTERSAAVLQLESGKTGQRPSRDVTTFLGFKQRKYLDEHILPATGQHMKEYEQPYLDDDAYKFQKYWTEKMVQDKRFAEDDRKRKYKLHKAVYSSLPREE